MTEMVGLRVHGRTALPLIGGSPLREDDGGESDLSTSTAGVRVPLSWGLHGLRPLNDGEFGSARPRRTALPLIGGSPLREDDGGRGGSHASTVGSVPLTGGFHGHCVASE